jgi:endonuclease/exonuclease/phosphatase family metal-dependent hydrolase
MSTVLDAINTDSVEGIVRPIDILLLQEQTSVETTTQSIVDILNNLSTVSSQTYVRGTLNGGTSGGGRPTVAYNSQAVQLIEEVAFGTVNTSNQARQTLRYRFRPTGYGPEADFYVYNNHYKAGDTATDRNRRQVEATALRTNLDALGEGTSAILAGDFNVSSNLEAMWTTLRAVGPGQVFDPINREGIWGNSSSFKDVHTQSPVTSARYSGQITGGMDDRFDFQLSTGEVLDGEGFAYIPNTYRAFGNNGTHPLNGEIDNPSNTAEPLAVLTALGNSSDHLPVIADYQLPSKMFVSTESVPNRVIRDATVSVGVAVENVAPVAVAGGADELDYSGSTSGSISGSFIGMDSALGGPQTHSVNLVTSNVGSTSGTLFVNSTSQSASNATFSRVFSFDVLDHSNASFSTVSDLNTLTIDFGIVAKQSASPTRNFIVTNLPSVLGMTADLDLDGISSLGSVAAFQSNLATFTGLDPSSVNNYSVSLNTSNIGLFEAEYILQLSDENLPGALNGTNLQLEFVARIALGGDANLDGFVTAADFAALQISFGGPGSWTNGDFNGDGTVSAADFAILQQNFGSSPGMMAPSARAGSLFEVPFAAVPESSSQVLLGCAAFLLLVGQARRRCRIAS